MQRLGRCLIAVLALPAGAAAECPPQVEGRLEAAADARGRGLYAVRMSEDEYIQHRIAQTLSDELRQQARMVEAKVSDGVVNLEGRTADEENKERVVAIAASIDGVRRVNADMLEVTESPPAPTEE